MTVPACLSAPALKALPDFDSGVVTASGTGTTNITVPDYLADEEMSALFSIVGGWGQSNESGGLYALNAAAVVTYTLKEAAAIVVPAGKAVYSVSAAGVETLITTFPNQSQSSGTKYVEFRECRHIKTARATGASGNNSTTFSNIRLRTVFDRAAILATLGTYDNYYLIK